jgi:hypothetical protein
MTVVLGQTLFLCVGGGAAPTPSPSGTSASFITSAAVGVASSSEPFFVFFALESGGFVRESHPLTGNAS